MSFTSPRLPSRIATLASSNAFLCAVIFALAIGNAGGELRAFGNGLNDDACRNIRATFTDADCLQPPVLGRSRLAAYVNRGVYDGAAITVGEFCVRQSNPTGHIWEHSWWFRASE